ncbi:MAG: AraC family transcriptional regulator [Cyanobacteria bacterium P01_B01_bin.77]
MVIRLTEYECEEQFQEANADELNWDPIDELDSTWKYDARFAQGWLRIIDLREGIALRIDQSQSTDRILIDSFEVECHYITCCFLLSGNAQCSMVSKPSEPFLSYATGQYCLRSNGLWPKFIEDYTIQPWCSVAVTIHSKILRSFAVCPENGISKSLQHLFKTSSQEFFACSRDIQPMMATVLQQILHCPYQGMIKRAYLESKAIELIALVLDHEVVVQQGAIKEDSLKPDQLERIYYAKEILLQDLSNPPSLSELAQQAGLNEFILKRGFRQTFGTTVFGELQGHRMETARQLLVARNTKISEVAHQVGYASGRAFARAFRRQFGMGPKAYQKTCQ